MATETPPQVHKIALWLRGINWLGVLYFGVYALFMCALAIWALFEGNGNRFILFLFYAVGFVFFAWLNWLSLQIHITTTPIGLEYYSIGFHLRTTWENTKQLKLIGAFSKWGIGAEVIGLNEPPEILAINWFWKIMFWFSRESRATISLFEFGNWRYTSLGDEIRKYAPHLLTPPSKNA